MIEMMYPSLTLDDQTEIIHSEMLPDNRVKVYIEKPDARDCFHRVTCYLPTHEWVDVFGFTQADIKRYQEIIEARSGEVLQKWHDYFGSTTFYC